MLLSDFDYHLPPELIAQNPPEKREDSRLLVLPRHEGPVQHHHFSELCSFLQPGDCLVVNDTRVIPARLLGKRPSGGRAELLLLHPAKDGTWECLARPARRLHTGARISFGTVLEAEVVAEHAGGVRIVRLHHAGDLLDALDTVGQTPLPPYIHRETPQVQDRERYQTVYARQPGAVAAPTAGLHFTPELLQRIGEMGVALATITLHVGLGTFRPIETERVEDHVMHAEWRRISKEAADCINTTRTGGGQVIAVGTTSVRTLESAADDFGVLHPGEGPTDIFIMPGHRFRITDGMITNFHLPRSSLLVMISAFAGRERVLDAYAQAIRAGYRFYSYGDAMLLL